MIFVFETRHTDRIIILVRKLPKNIYALARMVQQPELPLLTQQFLYTPLHPDSLIPASHIPDNDLPPISGNVYVYTSAHAVFYAPSDLSGLGGLCHKWIRSTQSWYGGLPHRGCVFVGNTDLPDAPGMEGLLLACVLFFFSFDHEGGTKYPCALFSIVGEGPCSETGMWIVEPDIKGSKPVLEVIHLDTILCGAHLIGVSGTGFLPNDLDFTFDKSLDCHEKVSRHLLYGYD